MKHIANFSIKRERKDWVAVFAKRELGDVYDKLQQQGNAIVIETTESERLPDNYIDVDVYVDFATPQKEMWYNLTLK